MLNSLVMHFLNKGNAGNRQHTAQCRKAHLCHELEQDGAWLDYPFLQSAKSCSFCFFSLFVCVRHSYHKTYHRLKQSYFPLKKVCTRHCVNAHPDEQRLAVSTEITQAIHDHMLKGSVLFPNTHTHTKGRPQWKKRATWYLLQALFGCLAVDQLSLGGAEAGFGWGHHGTVVFWEGPGGTGRQILNRQVRGPGAISDKVGRLLGILEGTFRLPKVGTRNYYDPKISS